MEIEVLQKINPSELNTLFNMLERIQIRKKTNTNNRRGFPSGHKSLLFGYTRARFGNRKNGKIFDLSTDSKNYPEIYQEILRIGNSYCPFKFTSIHLNKNVVCPKHVDNKNNGKSMIISFGNYTGCNLVVNDNVYDANCIPIIFDGSKLEHWNTDDLQGTKYSLVFFNGEKSDLLKKEL